MDERRKGRVEKQFTYRPLNKRKEGRKEVERKECRKERRKE